MSDEEVNYSDELARHPFDFVVPELIQKDIGAQAAYCSGALAMMHAMSHHLQRLHITGVTSDHADEAIRGIVKGLLEQVKSEKAALEERFEELKAKLHGTDSKRKNKKD